MRIPWFAKIGAKIVLARLPVSHQCWRRLGIFSHGAMLDPAYALRVFAHHHAQAQSMRTIPQGFVGLEIGPGDSLLGALAAAAHGAKRVYLVDSDSFADRSLSSYLAMIDYVREHGPGSEAGEFQDSREIEVRFGIDYRTQGILSLREIPDSSVDFIWSNAALEHVRLSDFIETCVQMRRILREGGVASHRVDLKDHLGGGLNNLRFSQRVWESALFADSGFYTNRIRFGQMMDIFNETGFRVGWVKKETWERLPLRRQLFAEDFRSLDDDNLRVSGFDVVLLPR